MKLMKVIDSRCPAMPGKVFDISHTLNFEYHGNGNASYYELEMTEDVELAGGGYVEDHEVRALQEWCRAQGAEDGETILINHWW